MGETMLKSCPFCGGAAEYSRLLDNAADVDGTILCCKCDALIVSTTEEEATEAWNRRAFPPDAGVVKALREAIDVLDGLNDDEINVELLPRLRSALVATTPDAGVVTDAMHHLGSVLVMLAELHADDRTDAFEAALAFHNQHNPDRQVQPEPAYETRLVHTGPMERAIAATSPDVSGLREALEPFAKAGELYAVPRESGFKSVPDDAKVEVRVGDLRRARAALKGSD